MRLSFPITAAIVLLGNDPHKVAAAFTPSHSLTTPSSLNRSHPLSIRSSDISKVGRFSVASTKENASEVDVTIDLDFGSVNKLTFRQLQKQCKGRGLAATGNTAALRARLLESLGLITKEEECDISEDAEDCPPEDIAFSDEGDPDFDFNALVSEIEEKASVGHWKIATRRLKKLSKNFATSEKPVPESTYTAVLEACLADRLHGARASEPARKILESMAEDGYEIPANLGNQCVHNCLGRGPNGSHDEFGGIDTALAMLAAMEASPAGAEMITVDTYGAVVSALSADGAVEEALLLLRAMVVDNSFTPALGTFDDVAKAAAATDGMEDTVLQVMALAKASGYVLDSIASAEAGRGLLASGIIAAEKMDNLALGLRLLTAAAKAEGCAPDSGDGLVASSSAAAQRACTLIHKRAIDTAIADNNWKLAVKLLTLMIDRSLTPSTSVWRKVVTVCSKCEKSRKATSLLLDWIERFEDDKATKPPLSIFNTVVNACEICGEEELTLVVLEAMKKVHESEGNIVTTNIALKRLAKLGNLMAVEGLIIGMLQAGVEPNVVSYTTAIGGCVKAENSAMAYEWLKRMRSRNVMPNYHTYNTALAACLDGKLESTVRASTIATEMMVDVGSELAEGLKGSAEYRSVIPDSYTKVLSRSLMKQLRENWRAGDIDMQEAKATVRVPLLKLVDFEKSEAAAQVQQVKEAAKALRANMANDDDDDDHEDGSDVAQILTDVVKMANEHRRMEV